jgi:hypothetical protein
VLLMNSRRDVSIPIDSLRVDALPDDGDAYRYDCTFYPE